jgi:hypothetical protein
MYFKDRSELELALECVRGIKEGTLGLDPRHSMNGVSLSEDGLVLEN